MKRSFASIYVLVIALSFTDAQSTDLAQIKVRAGEYDRVNSLVSVSLGGLDLQMEQGELVLYEITDGKETKIESQLEMRSEPVLWWKLNKSLSAGETAIFSLRQEKDHNNNSNPAVQVLDDDGDLIVRIDNKNVLQYNFNMADVPHGVSDLYRRAGFIHPIWSPKGEVLTRIQPPDHYHHYGLWNPWTHTEYREKVIDFWNLAKAEGTVKPVSIISKYSNPLFGGFKVLHEHIDLNGKTSTGSEVALKEVLDIRVWNIEKNGWVIDFTSSMNCATGNALKILTYRYQGFGFRGTEKWDDQSATLLTSEGKNKEDGNSTRARWCDVNGVSKFGTSGILFISNPSNFNYPEPIRIWPVGSNNGKENVFFNFNPSMDRDWVLEPGKTHQLKYRMYVYDGKIDKAEAESLWADFAYPPSVTIEIVN